jgi:hypothetical protein
LGQRRGIKTTRLRRPPHTHSSHARKRPSHTAPNVRDDRDTPSYEGGTALILPLICASRQPAALRRIGMTGKSGRDSHIELHRKPFKKGVSSKKTSKTPRKAEKNCVEASSSA